ncbi:MAG TPA: cytochrome c [Burkholderiaceae bacterium]|jgi:mono/diheme cytochrome c family protein|nr:cytochrome c [Burkholderiaceae bacterium]
MRIANIVPGALALACLIASAQAIAQAPVSGAPRLAPATAAALRGMQPDLDSPGEGRRLFLKLNCYSCHGMFAGGAIGPNIVGASQGEVEFNVMNGNEGGMPSFAKYVDETDITNLTNYLASIGTSDEPKFMDWWKKNPKK